jgi:hypothetical protein
VSANKEEIQSECLVSSLSFGAPGAGAREHVIGEERLLLGLSRVPT